MVKSTVYGSSDTPLTGGSNDDDCLDMRRYAEALARFVLHCDTPMTVGIQGEWGAGKTSLMKMMHVHLLSGGPQKDLLIFDFETWQYGAVGRDSDLGFLLMRSILRKIQQIAKDNESILYKIARIANRIAPALLKAGSEATINAASVGRLDGKTLSRELMSEWTDDVSEISAIKADFASLINELTGGPKGKGRAIIFVDDLDRIHPEKAVALMEIMKNFMDVPRCIFILACDYEVVRRGVAHRLGIAEADKAEAFFHKIIQVPFSMPTHTYQIVKLLDKFMKQRVADARLRRATEKVARMVESAIGTNPRSIKRFLNRVDLHSCLGDEDQAESQTAADLAGLMALVAMQMRWPRLAAHLAQQGGAQQMEALLVQLRDLSIDGVKESDDLVNILRHEFVVKKPEDWRNHPDLPKLQEFITNLWTCLDTQPDGALSREELSGLLRHATGISLTAVETAESRKDEREQGHSSKAGELKDEFSMDLISHLFTSERKLFRSLAMVNNGDYFQVYAKDNGKVLLSIQRRTGGLIAHLGSAVEKRDIRLLHVASLFRAECKRINVSFTEQSDNTRCSLDLKSLATNRDDFRALVIRILRDADAALGETPFGGNSDVTPQAS
jgi:hypothetical protein